MKKSEIEVGGHYRARVSGNLVTVRVDKIVETSDYKGRNITLYGVTNLTTKRRLTFRSAAKFRAKASGPKPASTRFKGGQEEDPMAPAKPIKSDLKNTDHYKMLSEEDQRTIICGGSPVGGRAIGVKSSKTEAEQRPDPTTEETKSSARGVEKTSKSVTVPQTSLVGATPVNPATSCPRCGQTVALDPNGRYEYHRKLNGITCGMSGEKVQKEEESLKPQDLLECVDVEFEFKDGNPSVTKSHTKDNLKKLLEGEQRQSPPNYGSGSDTSREEGEQGADPTYVPAAENSLLRNQGLLSETCVAIASSPGSPAAPINLFGQLSQSTTVPQPPHVIVKARAGTGKTFTVVVGVVWTFRNRVPGLWDELVQRIGFEPVPSPQQKAVWGQMELSANVRTVKFCAFNKSIVADFEGKWAWVIQSLKAAGIDFGFSTMHSMGLKAVTKAFGRLEVNKYVVQDVIAEILQIDLRQLRKDNPVLLKATADLVSLCKMNLTSLNGYGDSGLSVQEAWDEELSKLASHYDVDLNGQRRRVFDLVPQVLDRCRDPKRQGKIDYDDMVWLPVALDLPVFRFDLLLGDEVQDWNRCQQALAKKAGKRLILVGDERQAIYGFAGADSESMKRMERELDNRVHCDQEDYHGNVYGTVSEVDSTKGPGCVVLPLTVTRRCGKAIVEEAKKYVPDFEAHESNPEGSISEARYPVQKVNGQTTELPWEQTYAVQVKPGDFVLCRVNAPLVGQCFRFLKRGIKATIQGRDIGQGLASTVKKAKVETVEKMLAWLSDWLTDETRKEQAKRTPNEAKLIALQDRYECLVCFTEGCRTTEEVLAKIASVFTDRKDEPGVRFSSIHRAKGLESERVFFLQPEGGQCPHPMARSAWQREQEINLCYVGTTRAICELVFVY